MDAYADPCPDGDRINEASAPADTADDAHLQERLAEQSRLYLALRANIDLFASLAESSHDVSASVQSERIAEAAVTNAQALFRAPAALFVTCDDAAELVALAAKWADDVEYRSLGLSLHTARTRALPDLLAGQTVSLSGADVGLPYRYAAAPVRSLHAHWHAIEVLIPEAGCSQDDVPALLGHLAKQVGLALECAALHKETEQQGAQLRRYLDEIIATEERESRQLALDLHDGPVQQIVAAYQHLQTAQVWRGRDPGVEQREIQRGIAILRQAIVDSRRLIGRLRPAGLDEFGLVHALRMYVNQLMTTNSWTVTLEVASDWPTVSQTQETAIFRMVQEATTNALKHARADRLLVSLGVDEDTLVIQVQDWGCGFDATEQTASSEGQHLGLVGILERARLLGGDCEIVSAPGTGTTVTISLPTQAAANAQ